ncbi:MAG TPA: hypothetical protein VIU39_15635 [Anaerolineales bacterium]
MKSTHRIYLLPTAPLGAERADQVRMLQSREATDLFYDVDVRDALEKGGTYWFRVQGAGDGYAYRALIRAASQEVKPGQEVTVRHLGARMRLFGDTWYVDGSALDFGLARDLSNPVWPMSAPQLLALMLAVGVIVLEGLVLWAGLRVSGHVPNIRNLGIGAAIMVACLMALDVIGRRMRAAWI